jgi:GT2 family glycosyltransferase
MNERMQQPSTKLPRVAVVVLNWNGYEDTAACVISLQQATYANLQIILVDNGSTDGSAEKLERTFPGLTLIKLAQNGGYAAGNNAGIRAALAQAADYILVLNNDTTVEKGFLNPMVQAAERDPAIGIVTCKVYYRSEPNRIYAAGGTFKRWLCTGINDRQWEIDVQGANHQESEREITFAPGCAQLIRRSVFEKIGLLDERFFLYFEDLEFSRRVNESFRLIYVPGAGIYHKSGAGTKWASYTPTYLYYHTRNRLWVFKEEPWFYRAYVLGFTVLNALAKTLVIIHSRQDNGLRGRIRAIWRGVKDGVR